MPNNNYPVEDRNSQLLEFFQKLGYDVRLIGNPNQPKVIINNEFAISGYVHNRLYNFTTKPFGGEVVETINLNHQDQLTREDVDHLIATTEKRNLFKVAVLSPNEDTDRIWYYVRTVDSVPYFSFGDSCFFFDYAKAENCKEYLNDKYSLFSWIIETGL